MKKVTLFVVASLVIVGIVAWYATGVFAHRGEGGSANDIAWKQGYGYTQMLQTKAQILGMTVEELKEELADGKTFSVIAEEKGITSEEFHQKMLITQKERLQNMVEAGIVTEEQVEQRLQLMEKRHTDCDCDCEAEVG